MANANSTMQSLVDIQEYVPPEQGYTLLFWVGMVAALIVVTLVYRYIRLKRTNINAAKLLERWREQPASARLVCQQLYFRLLRYKNNPATMIPAVAAAEVNELETLLQRLRFGQQSPGSDDWQQVRLLSESLAQNGVVLR